MAEPLTLFPVVRADIRPDTSELLPLADYDRVLVMFSGGKDSTALALHMLELLDAAGVPRDRLELWHQLVDGAPEEPAYMDWPVTHAYCEAVAAALELPIRFQWREGGFLREMLRDGTPTAPVTVQDGHGVRETRGGSGPAGTRRKFPQVSADLSVRWCSAYLKIDVGRRAIARDPRLQQGRILVVTGERREEWGDGVTVQWGKSSYSGYFIETYPPGTYLTGHGVTLEEAEDRAWTQHQRELACPEHRWSPHQPGHGERLDGYGVCLDCGRHQADVLPVRTVCVRCGETVKLYSTRLCEPCHAACSDEELDRLDPTSAWIRRQGREMEAWRASRTPEQQAKEIIEALPAVLLAIAGDSGGEP